MASQGDPSHSPNDLGTWFSWPAEWDCATGSWGQSPQEVPSSYQASQNSLKASLGPGGTGLKIRCQRHVEGGEGLCPGAGVGKPGMSERVWLQIAPVLSAKATVCPKCLVCTSLRLVVIGTERPVTLLGFCCSCCLYCMSVCVHHGVHVCTPYTSPCEHWPQRECSVPYPFLPTHIISSFRGKLDCFVSFKCPAWSGHQGLFIE